jgi:hypothetical protein
MGYTSDSDIREMPFLASLFLVLTLAVFIFCFLLSECTT